ncbi:hypothetical protein [Pseudotabrizicola formosa]|uniref:hypothetical protein n=1 Tax=Pseudotabrizicola formosa TaxID=2030009 RepID=UPI000CD21E12|nr:hypothetical protein [Pseudotabrizicola formosa]
MRHLCIATCLALSFANAAQSAPAQADLIIEGRAAQALHCSAMLFIVSSTLYDMGEIARNMRDTAQRAALVILDQVPGTEEQRRRAMVQRFDRIMTSRTPAELVKEYGDTALWCRRSFLP